MVSLMSRESDPKSGVLTSVYRFRFCRLRLAEEDRPEREHSFAHDWIAVDAAQSELAPAVTIKTSKPSDSMFICAS